LQEFAKPSPGLLKILAESGETPGYTPPAPTPPVVATPPVPAPPAEDTTKKRKLDTTADDARQTKKLTVAAAKGKDWSGKPSEMDRLAQGLQKLQEDDLLQIVRIVTEHKTPEMYVKNDLEGKPRGFVSGTLMFCRGRV
jgi:transcription initiation factor TFIID/TFIIF subunit